MNEVQGQRILNELKATRAELAELRGMIVDRWAAADAFEELVQERRERALAGDPTWKAEVDDAVEAAKKKHGVRTKTPAAGAAVAFSRGARR